MHKRRVRAALAVCGWLAVLSVVMAFLDAGNRVSRERYPTLWILLNNPWLVCMVLFATAALLALEIIRTIKKSGEDEPWRERLLSAMRFKLWVAPFSVVMLLLDVTFLVFGIFFGVTLPLFVVVLLLAWLVMRSSSLDILYCLKAMKLEGIIGEEQYAIHAFYQKIPFADVVDALILSRYARETTGRCLPPTAEGQ